MKKLFTLLLAVMAVLSISAQDKEVKYSYPFETTTSHEYPATSTNSSNGTQNNILDLNGVGNAKTTLYAYTDGTYKIAAWCGVEGYDLDFSLADDGTITVLNKNAEYKESKGYWKVPTGLETYDRIQIFAKKANNDGNLRSEIKVSETQASVNLRYNSYVWETGNTGNASVMATYYGRGFAGTPTVYTIQEAAWDDTANNYVETNDLNTQKTSTANIYSLGDSKYVATDWMGENTGDLYFTVDENDSITVNDIANLCSDSGFWYFYNINLASDGIQPTWAKAYNDGTSYSFGFWYGTDTSNSDSYVYRYYFLEPKAEEVPTVATLVSVSPEAGSNVDIDTEYVLTFSKPVKYTTYLSDITLGQNPFGSGDGAIFSQNDDKTEIHAKLDVNTLKMYGVSTTEQAAAMFGSSLALHIYGVKDLETGEALEYNDEDENQFTFNYNFGEPVIKVDPKDGATLEALETVYFANGDGIAIADGTQKITIVDGNAKTIVYEIAASDLTVVEGEYGAPGYYSLTVDPAITANGQYTVQIPAGTFTLAGTSLNKYTEATYTVESGEAPATKRYTVDPEEGVVESLSTIVLTWDAPVACASGHVTVKKDGEKVATIDGFYEDDDPYEVTRLKYETTEPGVYTFEVPAGYYVLGEYGDESNEAFTLTYTIESAPEPEAELVWSKDAVYTKAPESFASYYDIYTDDQVSNGMLLTVEKWSDNRLIIKNWFGSTDPSYEGYQDFEVTYKYDEEKGYYTVTNIGGNACQGNDYPGYDDYFYIGLDNIWGTYTEAQYVVCDPSDESGYIYMYHDPYNSDWLDWYSYYVTWDPEVIAGIKAITADSENAPVYNVAGQRVNASAKGILIKNGKKYLAK